MRIPDPLTAAALRAPDDIAIVDVHGDRELTYAQLDERAGRLADWLRAAHGIAAGERVGLLSGNRVEVIETLFASARLGAIAVPLNRRLAAAELAGVVADAEPRLLLADAANLATAAELAPARNLDDPEWTDEVASATPVPDWGAPAGESTWYLLYTSGTTGRPKGVIHTFDMAVANHVNISTAIDLTATDVTLNALPMFHTGGINLYTLPTLFAGGTAVLAADFDPPTMLRLLERSTAFFGVPTMYRLLTEADGFDKARFDSMRSWASGGSAMPIDLLKWFADRGIVIRQGMGMTETGPTLFLIDAEHALTKAGSVGKPQVLAQAKLVDGDGRDTDEGELLVRGAAVTPGYWERPDATADTFTPDGWLRSGDIARRDVDGYYWIVDRVKDMYISGGENVYPAEVEHVLLRHDAITDAAVVGVADERWGETGCAIIVAEGVTASSVRDHCRVHLAGYKVPSHVVVVDTLPRNASGKLLKHLLRPATWRRSVDVTQADIDVFASLSGDDNPVHVDPEYAKTTVFGSTIAHGMLVFSHIRAAVDRHHPGSELADIDLSFSAPTRAGEQITVTGHADGARLEVTVTGRDGTVVCRMAARLTEGVTR